MNQEDKYRKALNEVVDLMALSDTDIKGAIKAIVAEIITVSLSYSTLGKSFQFAANKDLEKQINKLLGKLEDKLYNSTYNRCLKAKQIAYNREQIDEPYNDAIGIYLWAVIDKKRLAQRIKEYVLNFRHEVEAFIAVGIVNKKSQNEILTSYMLNIKSPFKALELLKAYQENGYKAERIVSKGISFGRGKYISSYNNLKRLEQDTIFRLYNYINQSIWSSRIDYVGWYTIRGSNFPCPSFCDPLVGVIHPKTESFLGYHSRCCCLCIPIFK